VIEEAKNRHGCEAIGTTVLEGNEAGVAGQQVVDSPGGKHRTVDPESGGRGQVMSHEIPCPDLRGEDLELLGEPLPKGGDLIGSRTPDWCEMTLRIESETIGRD
jgi:hypothetical protein